jgi:hypothetical protein
MVVMTMMMMMTMMMTMMHWILRHIEGSPNETAKKKEPHEDIPEKVVDTQ